MGKLPTIPGYIFIRKIDEGASAAVYHAEDEKTKREVAVKVLKPELFKDNQYAPRFLKEAEYAAQLNHPNIVRIYKVGQYKKFKYIVMEYLKESLKGRLNKRPVFPEKETFHVVKQVAEALSHAHSRGIIHRDIKPANILFRKTNMAVVADFGLARAQDATHLTVSGMILGTYYYMSPEQCRGKDIDHLSDIYSLGVILYEMLTGRLPYVAENTQGILIQHIDSPVPPLPEDLNKYQPLIDRMMAKDKSARIQRAREVIKLIEQFTRHRSEEINLPGAPHKPIVKINPGSHRNNGEKKNPGRPQHKVHRKKPGTLRNSFLIKLKEKRLKARQFIKRKRRVLRVLYVVLAAAIIVLLVMVILSVSEIAKNKNNKTRPTGKPNRIQTGLLYPGTPSQEYSLAGLPIVEINENKPGNPGKRINLELAGGNHGSPKNRNQE